MKMKIQTMLTKKSLFVFALALSSAHAAPTQEANRVINHNITEAEVENAQKAWGAALISISQDYKNQGIKKARATAKQVLDSAYGYNLGPVLFKPTLASGAQTFRTNEEGALAYFVGGNKNYPDDSGFALKGWEKYDYKNAAVMINGDLAITMGNVFLTDSKGQVTKVDKTWAFKKLANGEIRIVLHHSSLPYQPTPASAEGSLIKAR